MRVIPRFALGLLFMIASAIAAYANASLVKANPPVGSTVDAAPEQVVLTFTESLEPAFSKITVTNTNGAEVSQGTAQVNEAIMRVGLKPLSSGTYRVDWRAVSSDTQKIEGSFTFGVDAR